MLAINRKWTNPGYTLRSPALTHCTRVYRAVTVSEAVRWFAVPPKACSVILRHSDSSVGLISRSVPGTEHSGKEEKRSKGVRKIESMFAQGSRSVCSCVCARTHVYLVAETRAWFVEMCVQGGSVFSVRSSGSDSACCYSLQDSQTTGSNTHTHSVISLQPRPESKFSLTRTHSLTHSFTPTHLHSNIQTCLPCALRAGWLASVCRGECAVMMPMRLGSGAPRGGRGNCLCPRRDTPPPTEPAVGKEFEPHAHLPTHTHTPFLSDSLPAFHHSRGRCFYTQSSWTQNITVKRWDRKCALG